MKKLKRPLEPSRYFPPGYDWGKEIKALLGLSCGEILWAAMSFGTRMSDALLDMEWRNAEFIEDFYSVLGNALAGIVIGLAVVITALVIHYMYHHEGSKSIYLMRRLPDKWEMHRRCLTAPVIELLWFLMLGAILMAAMYGIYLLIAPEGSVQPGQMEKLIENWRVFGNAGN